MGVVMNIIVDCGSSYNIIILLIMTTILLFCLLCFCGIGEILSVKTYAPSWILKVGDHQKADQIARETGLRNVGQIGQLPNMYKLVNETGGRIPYHDITNLLRAYNEVSHVEQELASNYVLRGFLLPTDPSWYDQWPWYNIGQSGGTVGDDLNVVPVWIQGVSGQNTAALVIDNGIQLNHPDLYNNIEATLCHSAVTGSTNINPISSFEDYGHGTSCAGIIAMVHDNGVCGTGVAYNAKVAGFQFDFAQLTPSDEANAFNLNLQDFQVYSNSWGPSDQGFTVEGPVQVTQDALEIGVNTGRNGSGSIYIFSSGNGGQHGDSCAADGFSSNIYTIGVGSADQSGYQAYYDENCSAKMAVTYSYNSVQRTDQVATTFPGSECVKNFTGTSASAPLVTGVVLLALEVNPHLSWRDVQYLIVYTSKTSSLHGDFQTNGAGLNFNSQFGFGAINAEALVNRARYWTPVGPAATSTKEIINSNGYNSLITKTNPYTSTVSFDVGRVYLEHVVLTTTFNIIRPSSQEQCYSEESYYTSGPSVVYHNGPRRGQASIELCSPSGTCSTLLPQRGRDFVNCVGYSQWPFMSVHFWGEDPTGVWTARMNFDNDNGGGAALTYMALTLHYTSNKPVNIRATCDPACATPTGCSYGNSSIYCDECGEGFSRNVTTLECVRACAPGSCLIEGVCVFYNGTCPPSAVFQYLTVVIIVASILALVLIAVCICICTCICCCCCFPAKKYSRLTFQETDEFGYVPYAGSINPAVV